jgi:hypothetical protein
MWKHVVVMSLLLCAIVECQDDTTGEGTEEDDGRLPDLDWANDANYFYAGGADWERDWSDPTLYEKFNMCGFEDNSIYEEDTTFSAYLYAIDLKLAAKKHVPNFMILGVAVEAYDPFDDDDDDDDDDNDDTNGHGEFFFAYVDKLSGEVFVHDYPTDTSTVNRDIAIYPWIPPWFVVFDD